MAIDTKSKAWSIGFFNEPQPKEYGVSGRVGPVMFVIGIISKEYQEWYNKYWKEI